MKKEGNIGCEERKGRDLEMEKEMGILTLQYAQTGFTRSPGIVHISFLVSAGRRPRK
jgi:hypothetical protein